MKRIIAWFVDNSIAANLLMVVLLVGGGLTLRSIRQEEFPAIDIQMIQVSVEYLGATPEEVESGVCVRIEDAIDGTPGVDRYTTVAVEGVCTVLVWLLDETDSSWALSEVESRIGNVTTLPDQTERPKVSYIVITHGALKIAVSGDVEERTLKVIAQQLRDEIAALDGVSQVAVEYVRPYEISIEVSEQALRRYDLTFDQVAAAVRLSSLDVPGGSLKTEGGEILLRSEGQARVGSEFEPIVILTRPDGTTVRLGDLATVRDGFADDDLRGYFDGKPAAMISISRVGDEDVLEIADAARAFVDEARHRMPEGVELTIWSDAAEGLRVRIGALLGAALGGLFLVMLILSLILRLRLALWVAAGIPVSLLGALLFFPTFDFAISSLAVMGFILVLGIVVDDAIVVGERVYAKEQEGMSQRDAAVEGTYEVSVPVIFGVLTTMVAFSPLVLAAGQMGAVFSVLGGTVTLCLVFSLVEAQLILPAHLAHRKQEEGEPGRWRRVQDRVAGGLDTVMTRYYAPSLDRVLEWRYSAIAGAIAIMIVTGGLIASGAITFQFFPPIDGDRIYATLTMPQGVPLAQTEAAVRQLETAAREVREELDARGEVGAVRHTFSSIGKQMSRGGPGAPPGFGGGSHLAQVVLELQSWKQRDMPTRTVQELWRERVGAIPDAIELKFEAAAMHAGEPVAFELSGHDPAELTAAAKDFRAALAGYPALVEISDSLRPGKQELKLELLPHAQHLGVTFDDLARQVRTAFYGVEVQRVQRGQDDVRVMLRYPGAERRSLGDLENMRIRAPDGTQIPFSAVARADLGRGFASIRRTNGRRTVGVSAGIDRAQASPEEIMEGLSATVIPALVAQYPSVHFDLDGEQKERMKSMGGLVKAYPAALFVIYILLAIPLRSYVQPLIIMAAIPFGSVGAILGHFIMGWPLVFFSMLGIVALSGVVVNDSLVLVDFINRARASGTGLVAAVRSAGHERFRAIFLTSATTFFGLVPLMFNVNEATFFIVPIAISLAFGVLLATVITLFLVPCAYLVLDDVARLVRGKSVDSAPVLSGSVPSK